MRTASQVAPRLLVRSMKPVRNRAYLAFIRKQPCCVTGRTWGVEACHTGPHGLSQKASDLDAIPLTREFHQLLDSIGRPAFEQRYGVNIGQIIQSLQLRAEACGIELYPPGASTTEGTTI
jgi:hypothetical protein